MLQYLIVRDLIHLHQIQKHNLFPHLKQSWLSAAELDLPIRESHIWDRYIQNLSDSNAYLTNKNDEPLWVKNEKGGSYSPKLAYLVLKEDKEAPPLGLVVHEHLEIVFPN